MVDIGETCRRMFEGVVTGSSSSPSRDLRAAEAMHLWQSILFYAETIVSAAAMSFVNGKHRWPECMPTVWMFVSHSLVLLTERTSHNIFYEYNNMHIPRVGSDMWGTDFGSHHWGNYMNDDRETILLLFSVILSAYARTHIVGKPQHPQNCLFSVCWLMTCTDDPHKKKQTKNEHETAYMRWLAAAHVRRSLAKRPLRYLSLACCMNSMTKIHQFASISWHVENMVCLLQAETACQPSLIPNLAPIHRAQYLFFIFMLSVVFIRIPAAVQNSTQLSMSFTCSLCYT